MPPRKSPIATTTAIVISREPRFATVLTDPLDRRKVPFHPVPPRRTQCRPEHPKESALARQAPKSITRDGRWTMSPFLNKPEVLTVEEAADLLRGLLEQDLLVEGFAPSGGSFGFHARPCSTLSATAV